MVPGEVLTDVAEPIKDPARGQRQSLFDGAGTDRDGLLGVVSREQGANGSSRSPAKLTTPYRPIRPLAGTSRRRLPQRSLRSAAWLTHPGFLWRPGYLAPAGVRVLI